MKNSMRLGEAIDILYALKQQRRDLAKNDGNLKNNIKLLEDDIFQMLKTNAVDKSTGSKANVAISSKEIPVVDDRKEFQDYIKATGSLDLLNSSCNIAAVRERWAVGEEIPGIGRFTRVTLSVTKRR